MRVTGERRERVVVQKVKRGRWRGEERIACVHFMCRFLRKESCLSEVARVKGGILRFGGGLEVFRILV